MLTPKAITNILFEHESEGYSVNVDGEVPTSGYMVGGYVTSLVHDEYGYQPMLDTDAWLEQHWSYFTTNPRVYFAGVWKDLETGKIYIDISRNIESLDEAVAVGVNHGEIAIWDVVNSREIRLQD